jgi:hypothetical protein
MSVFSKVLLFINLFVALFLLFLTASIVQHRTNWTRRIDELTRMRDGVETEPILTKLEVQDPEAYRRVTQELQSRHARRQEANRALIKDQPLSEEARKFISDIGPEDYKRLVQRYADRERPKLMIEERDLAGRKAMLAGLRDGFQAEINDLQATNARFNERLKEEQDYEKRTQAENAERRREIALLYMELEEAVAARNLAQSQEKDMRDYLDMTRKQTQDLLQRNRALSTDLARKEGQQ